MLENVLKTLGSEWEVAVNNELNKLKDSERMLLGDVAMVVNRSDLYLGRPEEDCNKDSDAVYVVFYPSKYSIVCGKDFGAFANKDSNIKLISLSNLIDSVLEFNFTYLQLLYSDGIVGYSEVIRVLKNRISWDIEKEKNKERLLRKLTSMAHGLLSDLNSGKFKDDRIIKDRLFLALKVLIIVDNFVATNKFSISSEINTDDYNRIVRNSVENGKIKKEVLDELNKLMAKLDFENVKFIDKGEVRKDNLDKKYGLMYDVVNYILKLEEAERLVERSRR